MRLETVHKGDDDDVDVNVGDDEEEKGRVPWLENPGTHNPKLDATNVRPFPTQEESVYRP